MDFVHPSASPVLRVPLFRIRDPWKAPEHHLELPEAGRRQRPRAALPFAGRSCGLPAESYAVFFFDG